MTEGAGLDLPEAPDYGAELRQQFRGDPDAIVAAAPDRALALAARARRDGRADLAHDIERLVAEVHEDDGGSSR